MAWPSIASPQAISARRYKKQYKSTFETGRVVSAAAHATAKTFFTISWTAMTQTDLTALLSAFDSDHGSTFTWTHPVSSTSYTVGYATDEIQHDISAEYIDRYQVTVELEER